MYWTYLGVIANNSVWNVRYTNISAGTFTDIYTIFYEYNSKIIGVEIPREISLTRPEYIAMKNVF